ncbi:hypothetical protein CEXT_798711, partial [Caerostris extrusa]
MSRDAFVTVAVILRRAPSAFPFVSSLKQLDEGFGQPSEIYYAFCEIVNDVSVNHLMMSRV